MTVQRIIFYIFRILLVFVLFFDKNFVNNWYNLLKCLRSSFESKTIFCRIFSPLWFCSCIPHCRIFDLLGSFFVSFKHLRLLWHYTAWRLWFVENQPSCIQTMRLHKKSTRCWCGTLRFWQGLVTTSKTFTDTTDENKLIPAHLQSSL